MLYSYYKNKMIKRILLLLIINLIVLLTVFAATSSFIKMMAKSHKSAVVIIPPEFVWPQIQKIRKKYDKAYHRWMPHINLLYPFIGYSKSAYEEAGTLFEHALQSVQPFRIAFTLDSFGSFIHGRNATVWLKPVVIGMSKVKKAKKIPSLTSQPTTHPLMMKTSLTGYQPLISEVAITNTGLDALKDAVWIPNTEKDVKMSQEPSIDNLRFAILGDDREYVNKQCVELDKNITADKTLYNSETQIKPDEKVPASYELYDADFDSDVDNSVDPNQVHQVQSILQSVYPEFDDLSTMCDQGFQPHLTLGQCHAHTVDEFINDLQSTWRDVEFEVDEVCLIHREGPESPFEVDYRVTFGTESAANNSICRQIAPMLHTDIPTLPPEKGEHPYDPDICTGFPLVEEPQTWTRTNMQDGSKWRDETQAETTKIHQGRGPPKQKAPNIRSKDEFPALSTGKPKAPAGFKLVTKKKKGKK